MIGAKFVCTAREAFRKVDASSEKAKKEREVVLCCLSMAGFHYHCSRVNDPTRYHSQAPEEEDARGHSWCLSVLASCWKYPAQGRSAC